MVFARGGGGPRAAQTRPSLQNMISIAEILESDPSLNGEIPSVENVLANGDAAAWIADYCAARGAARGPAAAPVAWDWRLEDNDAISERIIVACSYVDLVASSKSIMSFWRAATPATVLQVGGVPLLSRA